MGHALGRPPIPLHQPPGESAPAARHPAPQLAATQLADRLQTALRNPLRQSTPTIQPATLTR